MICSHDFIIHVYTASHINTEVGVILLLNFIVFIAETQCNDEMATEVCAPALDKITLHITFSYKYAHVNTILIRF